MSLLSLQLGCSPQDGRGTRWHGGLQAVDKVHGEDIDVTMGCWVGQPDRIWRSSYWDLQEMAQQCGIFGSGVSQWPHNDRSAIVFVPAPPAGVSCVWQ